jgi:phenylalanyl-tRNA synthetase beta chain
LLESVALNLRHSDSCRLFEIGPVFLPSAEVLPDERERAALVLAGSAIVPSMYEREPRSVDFFDLKAALEQALEIGSLWQALEIQPETLPGYRPGASASLLIDGRPVGRMGALHPLVLRGFGLDDQAVLAGELELGPLLARARSHPDFDRLPSIEIDIACILPEAVSAENVRSAARAAAGPLLRGVEIFDVFRGPQFGEGRLAMALRLRLNGGDRTLEMSEALSVRAGVAAALRERLGATIRE